MSGQPEITQRDLRTKSREIMDAVEHGQSFTVTRDGHRIGELIPLRRRRRLVPRHEFMAMSRNSPAVDLEASEPIRMRRSIMRLASPASSRSPVPHERPFS